MDYIDNLNNEQTKEMMSEIDKNYSELKYQLPEPKYDKNGNLTNENQVKKALKKILPLLLILWSKNIKAIENTGAKIISSNLIFYSYIKNKVDTSKTMITTKEWNTIMDKILRDRQNKIKIRQVIKGNANVLNNQVQNLVQQMYRDGYSKPKTAKKLQQLFDYNKNKAKSIALTEKNFYKSEAQLQAIEGLDYKKTWIYNRGAKEPRETHTRADGKIADNKGYFNIGGRKTKAPQHFGIPSEDINCHCTMRIDPIQKVDINIKELNEIFKNVN